VFVNKNKMRIIAVILVLVGVLLVLFRRMARTYHKVRGRERQQFNQMEEYMLITGVVLVLLGGIFCFIL